MDLYIWRLVRIGFAFSRAYEVCIDYRKNNDLEGLDRYIADLEDGWRGVRCG